YRTAPLSTVLRLTNPSRKVSLVWMTLPFGSTDKPALYANAPAGRPWSFTTRELAPVPPLIETCSFRLLRFLDVGVMLKVSSSAPPLSRRTDVLPSTLNLSFPPFVLMVTPNALAGWGVLTTLIVSFPSPVARFRRHRAPPTKLYNTVTGARPRTLSE